MYSVGILGATGIVGQRVLSLLESSDLFEVGGLFASSKNAGLPFKDIEWLVETDRPQLDLKILLLDDAIKYAKDFDFFFSALPSELARDIEPALRLRGARVISNASAFRMDPEVPLLVPEILDNLDSLKKLLNLQIKKYGGFIVTNPNCSTIGLLLSIYPILKQYTVKEIFVSTMQAISGAGKHGLFAYDIFANLIPNISGEEEKILKEFPKITGLNPKLRVRTNRVPVLDGHSFSIFLKTSESLPSKKELLSLYINFEPRYKLDFLKSKYYEVYDSEFMPQVRKVAWINRGLSTAIGRIELVSKNELIISSVSNNISRGAAGGTILVAELVSKII